MQGLKNALLSLLLAVFIICNASADDAIPFTEFTYNPNICNGLRHYSGSQIYIPENAFVLKGGGACNGNIKIKYREIHSQADIVALGITMRFGKSKKLQHLESGGMFEIYADCNGQPLELAKGKQIQVRFASRNDLSGLNAYFFDAKKSEWQLLNTPITDFSVRQGSNYNTENWGEFPPAVNINGNTFMVEGDIWQQDSVFKVFKEAGIFKGMDIEKLGLYNYDRILNEDNNIPMIAEFRLEGSDEVYKGTVYVTYENINSVIYYTYGDLSQRFSLLPQKDIRIFTLLADGRIAMVPRDEIEALDFDKLRIDKKVSFTLQIKPLETKSPENLARATGIQR